jgi:general secretion pathway protein G
MMMRRSRQRGLGLIELIVAFTILMMLSGMAVPLARYKVRRDRERELRIALREMRSAIDKYKDDADQGKFGPTKIETEGYPETLEILVEGVKIVPAAHSHRPVYRTARVGNAQHAGRSQLHLMGWSARL